MERAGIAARQADVVAALTLEVLKGTSAAFDSGKSLCACSYSQCAFLQDFFHFLHFSTSFLRFPELFKKILASVDLQIMNI